MIEKSEKTPHKIMKNCSDTDRQTNFLLASKPKGGIIKDKFQIITPPVTNSFKIGSIDSSTKGISTVNGCHLQKLVFEGNKGDIVIEKEKIKIAIDDKLDNCMIPGVSTTLGSNRGPPTSNKSK